MEEIRSQEQAKLVNRKWSGALICVAHLILLFLAMINHLAISVPFEFRFLILMSTNLIWIIAHLICSSLLAYSLVKNQIQILALSFSTGVLGTWGFFSLMGALTTANLVTTDNPVSWAGPVLSLVTAGLAYNTSQAWGSASQHKIHPPGIVPDEVDR